jgi:hypothetical protein
MHRHSPRAFPELFFILSSSPTHMYANNAATLAEQNRKRSRMAFHKFESLGVVVSSALLIIQQQRERREEILFIKGGLLAV